jgi:hypothetical protein
MKATALSGRKTPARVPAAPTATRPTPGPAKARGTREANFNKAADQALTDILVCKPALGLADLDHVANAVMSQDLTSRPWRFTALIASKDGGFFKQVIDDASMAKALAPAAASLPAFAGRLRTIADLADTVYLRLSVAGCAHADFLDWMKDGREVAA